MAQLDPAYAHARLPAAPPSVLVMSDRLISLAQEADRAGYPMTAEHLVFLAHSVFDEKIMPHETAP